MIFLLIPAKEEWETHLEILGFFLLISKGYVITHSWVVAVCVLSTEGGLFNFCLNLSQGV